MNFIVKLWSNFKKQPDSWLFYGFLVTFPLSIRKILFFYPVQERFNEYTSFFVYLSDIFLLATIAVGGIIILYNNKYVLSIYKRLLLFYIKHKIVYIPLLLVFFSFVSSFWAFNQEVAIFRSLKLFEFYLLYLWVIFRMFHPIVNVPRGTFYGTSSEHQLRESYLTLKTENFPLQNKCSTWNIFNASVGIIICTGAIQSIVAIWQFIAQRSIGLPFLGESIISPNISGVAKVVLDGEKVIRAYGLFPHPNILGGFLVLSIVLTFAYFKPLNFLRSFKKAEDGENKQEMFHVEHSNDQNHSAVYILESMNSGKRSSTPEMENVPRGTFSWRGIAWNMMFYLILGTQIIALLFTFSKSAWLGLFVILALGWIKNVPRGTFLNSLKAKAKYFALLAGITFLLIVIIRPNWYSFLGKSIEDRMFYLNVSRGTFLNNPLLGIGMGQYAFQLDAIPGIQNWQFQPVHNVFILVLNELGIIGLILLGWFFWKIVKNVPRGTFSELKFIFIAFLIIMLFDHYFWDIQQGQIMLWLILAFAIGDKFWITRQSTPLSTEKDNLH